MKKLSVFIALSFAVTFAMAQNTATVNQFGSNIGSVVQTGTNNNATIQQGSLGSEVTNNHSPAYNGDWIEGSFINQTGSSNSASTTVRTNNNGTKINQVGEENMAIQEVGSTYERTTDPTKMGLQIDQQGNGNMATQKTIKSFGSYGIQGMTILQAGINNVADQVSIGGMQQTQRIKQIGNNNNKSSLNLTATGLANPLTALDFKFNSTSNGPAVVGLPMTQYSNQRFGTAIMNVTGDDNNTYQFQEYRVWSTSGDNDEILNLEGSRNNVAQGQLGEKNYSDIELTGSDNVVSTSQFGDLNIANVSINGNFNVAGIEQTGNSNTSNVMQVGNGNFANVVQTNP